MGSAVAVRRLSKSFAGREVLRDVTLDVERGTILGLLGANGAGKTTLLEILSTLLLPTSGSAVVEGHDVAREAAAVRRLVGYSPCGFDTFYPRLTADANLEFFAGLSGFGPRAARRRLDAVYDLVGINGSRRLVFQKHSTGMKQKLALARMLITDPQVMLLDEPTRSLDPPTQDEIWRLFRALVGDLGKSILLVTHNPADAERCDRVAVLHEGRVVDLGRPSQTTRGRIAAIFESGDE